MENEMSDQDAPVSITVATGSTKDNELQFMIALDIHFYLKHGSIKGAIQSMFDFLATFGKYLNQVEAVKVLSFAFYLTLLGRFG
jgi:hypothetical protein